MQYQLEQKMNSFSPSVESASTEPMEQRIVDVVQQYSLLEAKIQVNEAALATLEASRNTIYEQIEMIGVQSEFQTREIQLSVDQLHYNLTEIQAQCEQALQRTVIVIKIALEMGRIKIFFFFILFLGG